MTMRFDPFRDPFRDLDRLTNQLVSGVRTPSSLPLDAWRADDGYHVALDLPGVDPSSIELTVERGALTVSATRRAAWAEGDQVLLAERPQGSSTRQVVLGDGVDAEGVQADYVDGVLHLLVPVRASAQPRRIAVGRGGGTTAHSIVEVGEQRAVGQAADSTTSGQDRPAEQRSGEREHAGAR